MNLENVLYNNTSISDKDLLNLEINLIIKFYIYVSAVQKCENDSDDDIKLFPLDVILLPNSNNACIFVSTH